jgi:hypothetical protein
MRTGISLATYTLCHQRAPLSRSHAAKRFLAPLLDNVASGTNDGRVAGDSGSRTRWRDYVELLKLDDTTPNGPDQGGPDTFRLGESAAQHD